MRHSIAGDIDGATSFFDCADVRIGFRNCFDACCRHIGSCRVNDRQKVRNSRSAHVILIQMLATSMLAIPDSPRGTSATVQILKFLPFLIGIHTSPKPVVLIINELFLSDQATKRRFH